MQCNWGVFATLDFLYFYARENDLAYANVMKTVHRSAVSFPMTATVPSSYKHVDTKWKPGVRVGLGWNMECDGWDLYANWTYYKGEGKGSTSVTPFNTAFPTLGNQGVLPLWTDNAIFYANATSPAFGLFNSMSAKWDFTFNSIDVEMGRRYYLSECFTMRPYTGLRATWTRTNFTLNGKDTINVVPAVPATTPPQIAGFYDLSTKDSFTNHNWGVGLLAGFQPVFYFTEEFCLYANADAALLWGKFRNTTKRSYSSHQNGAALDVDFSASANGDFAGIQPMLDLALGVRWETYWCEKRYGFELDAGWEHHVLFNHNYRVRATNATVVFTPVDGGAPGAVSINSEEGTNNLDWVVLS